jgi:hypothetical protein
MFKRMVLKRVLDEVGRLENATKKRSKGSYCGIREVVLNCRNDEKSNSTNVLCSFACTI